MNQNTKLMNKNQPYKKRDTSWGQRRQDENEGSHPTPDNRCHLAAHARPTGEGWEDMVRGLTIHS